MRLKPFLTTFLLLITPAFADDMALFAFSWLLTGGPLAPYFAALWGVKASEKLRPIDQRLAIVLTVIATFLGYWKGAEYFCAIKFSTAAIQNGVGMLTGPALLLAGAVAGRLPSLVYQLAYSVFGVASQPEERLERLG